MRVIGGFYRGRVLKSPANFKTRPTSDRLRETLFNILHPCLTTEANFLDLCAGTGAIGIEALSRGVQHSTFVEISRKMCGLIEENLDHLEIPETQTEIICEKAEKFLAKTKKNFDLVYFDPPYENNYLQVLQQFGEIGSNLLATDGIFIAEHSAKSNLPDLVGELRRWRIVKQGDSVLSFYEKK
jgi:16S rRNA (guanine(966)-N(2))-methyltransferase RsmD